MGRVYVGVDKKLGGGYSGVCYTTLWICLMPLNFTLTNVKMTNITHILLQ